MRCSTIIPSILLVLLLAIFNVAVAKPANNNMLSSDNIEDSLVHAYFDKRAKGDHGGSETATATTATEGTATETADASATSTATKKKTKAPAALASPAVLQDGTLFYIGVAVTCLLWTTGKAIDVKMERQEKYAESLIHSI